MHVSFFSKLEISACYTNLCKSHSEENVIFKKLSFKFNAFKRCGAAVEGKIAAKMRGGRNIWSCASIWQKTFLSASGLWSWIICFSPKVQLSFHPFSSCHWYIFLQLFGFKYLVFFLPLSLKVRKVQAITHQNIDNDSSRDSRSVGTVWNIIGRHWFFPFFWSTLAYVVQCVF